jgi:hypothetical protein
VIQEAEEKLRISNENLIKKVEFFKQRTSNRFNDDRKQYESRELELKKQANKTIHHLKMKASRLLVIVNHLQQTHRRENSQIQHDIKHYKNSIKSIFELLAIRLNEEGKKATFYKSEIKRLKKNVDRLEKIHNDYDFGVKARNAGSASRQNTSSLTYNCPVETKTVMTTYKQREGEKGQKTDREKTSEKRKRDRTSVRKKERIYLSPIKPVMDHNCDVMEKLEISQLEKESMEIERRVRMLRKKTDSKNTTLNRTSYKLNKENVEFNVDEEFKHINDRFREHNINFDNSRYEKSGNRSSYKRRRLSRGSRKGSSHKPVL